METIWILVNIAIMFLFIGILFFMQKKHLSFSKRVFAGLGLGILLGALLQIVYSTDSNIVSVTTDWYNILGRGYVRLLMMIVIPLILVSIIQSIINLEKSKDLGKMSAWIIGILVTTAMIAATVGVTSATIFDLSADQIDMGQAEEQRGLDLEERLGSIEGMSTPQKILEFIPSNPFLDMTGQRATSTIAVVIFSIIVGIAVLGVRRKQPEQAEKFVEIINALYAVVMRIVKIILRLTPYGILGLMQIQ